MANKKHYWLQFVKIFFGKLHFARYTCKFKQADL
jgi:hypothetical protein